MSFHRIEYLDEGELLPYIYYVLSLPKYRVIRFMANGGTMIGLLFLTFQSYIFLKTFNISTFLQYSSFYLLQIYMVITTKLWVLCYDNLIPQSKRIKSTFFWSLSMCSEEMRVKILVECRWAQFVSVIELFSVGLLVITNLYLWTTDFKRYYLLSPVVLEYAPGFARIFHCMSITIVFLSTVPMICTLWYTFYMLAYLKMQMYMLVDHIQTFGKYLKSKRNKLILPDDIQHQENVARHLKFFIGRHQSILEFRNFLKNTSEGTNFLVVTSSILVSLYTVITVYSELFNLWISFLALFVFWTCLIINALVCQNFEDSSEDLERAVYDLEWYFWSIRNMKTFLIFHKFITSRKITVPVPSFMSCNVEILKSFAKASYSLSNILHSMKTR